MAGPVNIPMPGGLEKEIPTELPGGRWDDALCQNPRDCSTGGEGYTEVVLVWPPHVAQIAFWLLVVGLLVFLAWWYLRGDSCWKCGRDKGLCPHTRYDTPKDL